MKITMYRASGSPIKAEHNKLYFEKLNEEMDKLPKCTQENAKDIQEVMEVIHRDLTRSYPNSKRIQCPTSPKEVKDLCNLYGSVAFCLEDDDLVLYILDK